MKHYRSAGITRLKISQSKYFAASHQTGARFFHSRFIKETQSALNTGYRRCIVIPVSVFRIHEETQAKWWLWIGLVQKHRIYDSAKVYEQDSKNRSPRSPGAYLNMDNVWNKHQFRQFFMPEMDQCKDSSRSVEKETQNDNSAWKSVINYVQEKNNHITIEFLSRTVSGKWKMYLTFNITPGNLLLPRARQLSHVSLES